MLTKPFKKIGIGVTFSPNLKANIYEASRLALMFHSNLVLIHVGEKSDDSESAFLKISVKKIYVPNKNIFPT